MPPRVSIDTRSIVTSALQANATPPPVQGCSDVSSSIGRNAAIMRRPAESNACLIASVDPARVSAIKMQSRSSASIRPRISTAIALAVLLVAIRYNETRSGSGAAFGLLKAPGGGRPRGPCCGRSARRRRPATLRTSLQRCPCSARVDRRHSDGCPGRVALHSRRASARRRCCLSRGCSHGWGCRCRTGGGAGQCSLPLRVARTAAQEGAEVVSIALVTALRPVAIRPVALPG
jgi:hypothetical protein